MGSYEVRHAEGPSAQGSAESRTQLLSRAKRRREVDPVEILLVITLVGSLLLLAHFGVISPALIAILLTASLLAERSSEQVHRRMDALIELIGEENLQKKTNLPL